jgi:hypothetical protein
MKVKDWWHYLIEMPVDANGAGPATVGVDAVKITYEVWDRAQEVCRASFDNLPDAIDEAMRRNAAGQWGGTFDLLQRLDKGEPCDKPCPVRHATSGCTCAEAAAIIRKLEADVERLERQLVEQSESW